MNNKEIQKIQSEIMLNLGAIQDITEEINLLLGKLDLEFRKGEK